MKIREKKFQGGDLEMAEVGDKFSVGEICPETGRYKHTVCDNTEIYNKGNPFAPCSNASCPNKGAQWQLQEKLT